MFDGFEVGVACGGVYEEMGEGERVNKMGQVSAVLCSPSQSADYWQSTIFIRHCKLSERASRTVLKIQTANKFCALQKTIA